ncbi:MAG: hypothetical protein LBV13_05720, partial [Methanomassiliicoccaceae archaeon]|nr:hypothetical protein [Methanomassiliicoccaceae archaeon]
MRKHLRLFTTLAAAMLIAGAFATFALYDPTEDGEPPISSPGLKDPAYFEENGYKPISSAAELQKIGNNPEYPIDGKYYLANDILEVGSFIPLGTEAVPFTGVFDGNGFVISGLNVYVTSSATNMRVGLFSHVGNSEICNLGIIDSSFTFISTTSNNDFNAAGAFVGMVNSLMTLTITDCYSDSNRIFSQGIYNVFAGGLIGGTLGYVEMVRCYNTSTVESSGITKTYAGANAGGLMGITSKTTTITDCYNSGYIKAAGLGGSFAGGLVPYATATSTIILNSHNSGTIEASGANPRVGGLVADNYSGSMYITDSYNTGRLTANESGSSGVYIGGILGYKTNGEVKIFGCYNTGDIVSSSPLRVVAGGILSYFGVSGATYGADIKNCYNTGNIDAAAGTGIAVTGGILGWLYRTSASTQIIGITATVSDSYNEGNMTALSSSSHSMAGGIFGYISGSAKNTSELTITANAPGCYNTGMLSVTSPTYAFAGGILAYSVVTSDPTANAALRTYISDSYNLGDIIASAASVSTGGIVAYVGTETTIVNCYSTSISIIESVDESFVGGIIGYADKAVIENCYYLAGVFNVNDLAYDAQLYSGTAKVDGNDDGTPREG